MIDGKKLARVKSQLSTEDIEVLRSAVTFCAGGSGRPFKDALVGPLLAGFDHVRMRKIEGAVRQLNEDEIIYLVENPTPEREERKQRQIRGGFSS